MDNRLYPISLCSSVVVIPGAGVDGGKRPAASAASATGVGLRSSGRSRGDAAGVVVDNEVHLDLVLYGLMQNPDMTIPWSSMRPFCQTGKPSHKTPHSSSDEE